MLFALLSLAMMVVDYRTIYLVPVKKALSKITDPVRYLVDLPHQIIATTEEFFSSHATLVKKNEKLQDKVALYAAKAQKLEAVIADNKHLRKQLNAVDANMKYQFLLAEIMSVANERFSRQSILNRGLKVGIYTTQVVLSEGYIYGQIVNVSSDTATAMQLIDAMHAIPVKNKRNGMRALAVGTGAINVLDLKNVEAVADIRSGDVFVSSGLGELFPADYPVAKVTEIKYIPGDSFVTVKAKTFADFEDTRKVILIWGNKEQKLAITPSPNEEKN